MAGSDALKRIGGGRWETRDGRFQIEPQSGTWVIVDTTQTNEFGLPLVRGPFGSLGGGQGCDRGGADRGPGRVAAGRADRGGQAPATRAREAEGREAVEGRQRAGPEGIEGAGRCHRPRRRLGQAARARTASPSPTRPGSVTSPWPIDGPRGR